MKSTIKALAVNTLLIMSTVSHASDFTESNASDLLKKYGKVQAHYAVVDISLEDPKQAIESANSIFKYGVPGFLSDISGLSHIDSSGEVLKAMAATFENGEAYLPENATKTVQNQQSIVIKLYQEILDAFCWGSTEGIEFEHALEVTASEVAALYVARQRIRNLMKIWEKS